MAVTEAVANSVEHAYPGGAPGQVQITAWADEDTVQVAVRDLGSGLHPNPDREGGRGLAVIRSVADRVFIASTEFGVEVVMTFPRRTNLT
jgi:anti-sigma regulatory factor (Ser/Thr protein kinase)